MVISQRYAPRSKRSKWTLILLCVLAITVALVEYQRAKLNAVDAEIRTTITEIKDSYGVTIHYRYDLSFFPLEHLTPPASAKGSQVSLSHVRNLLPIVEQFLSSYPRHVLQKNLSDIYLVGKLEFYGKDYGGTYLGSSIYIRTKGTFFNLDDWAVLGAMHSELASILFHNYRFPKKEWQAVNPPGWTYLGSGFDMLGRRDLYAVSQQLFKNGFLEKYAQSSLENDFKMVVDWAFARPYQLQAVISKHERIRKKFELAKQFYHSIDPRIEILTQMQLKTGSGVAK